MQDAVASKSSAGMPTEVDDKDGHPATQCNPSHTPAPLLGKLLRPRGNFGHNGVGMTRGLPSPSCGMIRLSTTVIIRVGMASRRDTLYWASVASWAMPLNLDAALCAQNSTSVKTGKWSAPLRC